MQFIFVILCLVVVSNEGLAERCDADYIQPCLLKAVELLQKVDRTQYIGLKNFTIYCSSIEQQLQCIKKCEADFPILSKLVAVLNFYMSEFCGENGKMFMSMGPCFQANVEALEQCKGKEVSDEKIEELSKEELVCIIAESLMCTAKVSKEKCKNGGDFFNAVEKRMEKKFNACSGAGYMANSFLTLATFLTLVLIRNKLQ